MLCPSCDSENREGRRYCAQCGTALGRACSGCGAGNEAGDRFCGSCGTVLDGEPDTEEASNGGASRAGDIRQLSVLFCDLVGSTAHARRLGDEDWLSVARGFERACARQIERWGGYVAQYLGDGVLAYFGFPTISEDHAERAVRCGLALFGALERLNEENEGRLGLRLEARVGIHTGRVVTLEEPGSRPPVLGATVHLASRYEGIAPPDSVVISQATCDLIAGRFEVEALGPHQIRGVEEPVPAYRVVRALERLPPHAMRDPLAPLIGRREELALMKDRWSRVMEGAGQVAVLTGDPGIGKSRLFQELRSQLSEQASTGCYARCSRYQQNSPLAPIVAILEQAMGFEEGDGERERGEKLEAELAANGMRPEEAVPVLRQLLGLAPSPAYPPPDLPPEASRRLGFEVFFRWLEASTHEGPVILGIEDLQWADPSTLGLVNLVVRGAHSLRVFLLLTFRSGFDPGWGTPSHLTMVVLPRLLRGEAERIAAQAAGGVPLSRQDLDEILSRADGLPLYVEELTKVAGKQAPDEARHAPAAPHTLQALLGSRLESLGPAREVAQLAAVMGDDCSFELLSAVAGLDAATLEARLDRLVEAELLTQRGAPPRSRYAFKHELVSEAAYQALLREHRQALHGRMAQELEARLPQAAREAPERIAHHHARSDQPVVAIAYWRRAARQAMRRYAMEEAARHAWEALQLVPLLPDREERLDTELQLQLLRANAFSASRGFGNESVEAPARRAVELCNEIGASAPEAPVLALLCGHYMQRGDFRRTRELADTLVKRAEEDGDSRLRMIGLFLLGTSLLWCGEYEESVRSTERARSLYDPRDRSPIGAGATDPGIVSFGVCGLARWCLGQPDAALADAQEGLDLARGRDTPHHHTIGWALTFKSQLLLLRREGPAAAACGSQLRDLASEHGFKRLEAWGRSLAAAGRIESGEADGVGELEAALEAYGDAEAGFWRAYFFGVLARGQAAQGERDEALQRLHLAQQRAASSGERFYEGDLYRIEGDILLEAGVHERAETALGRALEMARDGGAASWELRALISLTRLRRAQGREDEIREALARRLASFEEGHQTPDLVDAAALLKELG